MSITVGDMRRAIEGLLGGMQVGLSGQRDLDYDAVLVDVAIVGVGKDAGGRPVITLTLESREGDEDFDPLARFEEDDY